jgi:hypothetical protein
MVPGRKTKDASDPPKKRAAVASGPGKEILREYSAAY